jgi:RNA-directed DNA polymerase
MMAKQIRAWLKAGIMEGRKITMPTAGTPQGGIISPLLANIALHGLEEHLKKGVTQFPTRDPKSGKTLPMRDRQAGLAVIRYADDFVVTHANLEIIL